MSERIAWRLSEEEDTGPKNLWVLWLIFGLMVLSWVLYVPGMT